MWHLLISTRPIIVELQSAKENKLAEPLITNIIQVLDQATDIILATDLQWLNLGMHACYIEWLENIFWHSVMVESLKSGISSYSGSNIALTYGKQLRRHKM